MNQHDIAQRWAEVATGSASRLLAPSNSNVRVYTHDPDQIYSYGTHFELGRIVRDTRGKPLFFLLNGDRASVSTSGHQSVLRQAVTKTGVPYMIAPYSALNAAGIDLDSVRPLDIQPDRTWSTKDYVTDAPSSDDWTFIGTTDTSTERYDGARWESYTARGGYSRTVYFRGHDYGVGKFVDYDPPRVVDYRHGSSLKSDDIGSYVEQWHHFLGASVFTAQVFGLKSRRKFLSAFDENERQPLYFLCELPRTPAKTYAEALDALAPRAVHAALAQGRDVKRQGDVFAIPVDVDTRTLKRRAVSVERFGRLFGTDHTATDVIHARGGAVYGRGVMRHDRPTPDHVRVKLGKQWHLIVRNTVPRRASRPIRQRSW